jgi:uroporphyrin-III C-methyltransferase
LSTVTTYKNSKVILAGAGPGDKDLITVKLSKALQQADVIITDRLVNPEIISTWARPGVEILYAGKQGYNDASCKQKDVNEMILECAAQYKTVLRLKGGDIAFFSNVLDELQTCTANNIAFEIIPGVTSASAASAYTGMPLTARGYAQGIQVLTYTHNSFFTPERWKYLANTHDTLVFYMALKNIINVAELLLRYTKNKKLPLAIIEQASTPNQKITTTTLENCKNDIADKTFSSPALIVIGEVVALANTYNWFESNKAGNFFADVPVGLK